MRDFLVKELIQADIESELSDIGFDEEYRFIAANKYKYKNIKIYGLSSAQANILKQTALAVGADCATNKNVITANISESDVILGGSVSQIKQITEKLMLQPFKLKLLAENILKLLDKKSRKTKLAGILNITPDSFSDGGAYYELSNAKKHFLQLIDDGADIVDIGAESTRPYSEPVEPKEQIKRLSGILDFVQKENINIPISVDTRSSEVADFALNSGASIINDVSGFEYDERMPKVVAGYSATLIIQHSKGNPQNMQNNPVYTNITDEIFKFLEQKANYAKTLGVKNVIIDPGIGFGKTKEDNYNILDRIEELYSIDCPIMVGVSRKSFLGIKENDNDLKDIMSLALSYPLVKKNIDYLRVHNVKLHKNLLLLG